ncbi:ubl carboxyl-terminal hydrolase 18 isoform X3 [Strigops habroptila]|uniref:ubl carboxyl-terminal hydrolase 18 isoform X3 n=1 Tax=Strigops habroptila TaxID=2489341 RepID=UPI0011CF35ED|nr:ubl carboxyl-terminal hydrolase 18 isoform X3 [Strigops habroptila]
MGQRSGRQETSRKLEMALSETMKAEAEVQNNEEEAEDLKAKVQRLTSVFGVADLKNGLTSSFSVPTEAIGLYNVGQSCCLNSLLQVFFMNIRFTRILRRITVPLCAEQKKRNVPYQMLLLLEEMQCGKRKAVYPIALAYCLSVFKVKLFVQHDAAQLFLTLWNLIKRQMKKPELVEDLNDLYTICVQEHLACQKCSFEEKRNSSMLTLPLPLLDSNCRMLKTLKDCLQYFFHPEELTGHNMCFCDQCGRKTPFLQAGWQYDLFAVIAHSGSISCGHYCAYIRSLTECKWYCFNDSEVCQVSWDDVKCTYGHSNLHWGETAYLLIYMKKHPQWPYPGV